MFILGGSFLQHTMNEAFRNFGFFFFNLGKVGLDEVIFKFFPALKCHNPRSMQVNEHSPEIIRVLFPLLIFN